MTDKKLTFDESTHTYRWGGKPVPSVTQVLSRVGTIDNVGNWKPVGFDSRWIKDDTAAKFGTAFHKVAAIIFKGGLPKYPESMKPWIAQLEAFYNDTPMLPLCDSEGVSLIEYPMYHSLYRYCGTPDLVAMNHNEEVVIYDWKTITTNQHHLNLQTAAYAELIKHCFKIKKKIIRKTVRFSEDNYVIESRENHPEDFIAFQSCLNVLKMAA